MKFIITIDTEEDNWTRYSTTENTVENVEKIVPLQALFDQFDVKPTYLVTYPVATNPSSVSILKKIHDEGKCEIGMHCHPWNTPPFDGKREICEHDTMICNLPEELQYLKLASLYEAIRENFHIAPVSFRAGRWGFGAGTARALHRLGIGIDTSITPYENWNAYQGPDFSSSGPDVYRFNPDNIFEKIENGSLLQVPATVGFLQSNFRMSHWLMKATDRHFARKLHLGGILNRLRLLNKVWLAPEIFDSDSMIKLAIRMQENNFLCLNMMFHSNSLLKGMTPFVKTADDEQLLFNKIRVLLMFARSSGWASNTLSQFGKSYSV